MTVLGAVLVVLAVLVVVGGVWAFARRRVVDRAAGAAEPDDELVRRLTDEVRKWRAEAGYWQRTAERLQRELDGRPQS